MLSVNRAQPFNSVRVSQSLCNDRCQNILYKAVFEHFKETKWIAALLLTSKSFQNSSFGANFIVNFVIDKDSIRLLDSVVSPSSCFSLQFAPSLHINQSTSDSEKVKRSISEFVREIVCTKYLKVSLRSLNLDYAAFEVVSIFFGNFSNAWPQLLSLHLKNCVLSETVLKAISKNVVNLRIVNFSNTNISFPNHLGITDSLLEHISKLSGITSLNLSRCSITDAGLERVATLSGITSLNLCRCSITDAGLERVATLSGITSLNLVGCRITDTGLERVSTLSGTTSLNFACCDKITDVGLEHLSKLANITWLNLTWCDKITDTGLESVSKLSNIISLNLAGCRIRNASLEIISRLSSITSLSLAGCRGITDEGFQHLAKLSDITSLNLSYCDITDAGLLLLSKLSGITSLDLSGRNITDADIKCIANLPKITYLNLHRSAYEATKKLATALPNCWIGHDEVWEYDNYQDDSFRPVRRPRSVN